MGPEDTIMGDMLSFEWGRGMLISAEMNEDIKRVNELREGLREEGKALLEKLDTLEDTRLIRKFKLIVQDGLELIDDEELFGS